MRRSAAGDRKGDGRHSQNLLHLGGRPARHAGTGGTGLRRILISRPNAQFDDDIGFLPGDESEKIAPLLRPVVDNLELLVDQNEKERFADERSLSGKVEELFDRGIVDAQALNFIRGRSISKTYLVIDEAQNLTPKQAKGIITRAGMGTKIILLGDPQQIDHPLLTNAPTA